MNMNFLTVDNGQPVQRDKIPHLSFENFREEALAIVGDGGNVVQFFAYQDTDHTLKMLAVLRSKDHTLLAAGCDAPPSWPALSAICRPFHLFEREMAEQFGLRPEGHPWLKMVRYHANWMGKEDIFGNDYGEDIPGNYDYYSVTGDEIHEVAVGPVHAGVIEPGHFRFNCIGEKVLHLEIQLGYQHRGVELLLLKAGASRLPIIAEGIAGDTAIGHSLCMAQAVEGLAGIEVDQGARISRTIALELERIANHVGDLGALSGDVAFLPVANYCGRMRGDFLNMSLWMCGNRFGKGLVRPGGVRFALTDEDRSVLLGRINELKPQVEHVIDLLFSTSSVRARFEDCGVVPTEIAKKLGLVGPSGRASSLPYDARRCFPTEYYSQLSIPESALAGCDVYARARVRADEVLQSIGIIQSLLSHSVNTQPVETIDFALAPSSFTVAINEAWRGEVSHALLTDGNGKLIRYKIKDPSFHNWNGLAMALRNTGISDFPLNNKSFNLSYCGFDL
ncbi:MAG: hydrogenase [Proteobacteria bacterium]|nr:hydrogenase [Pseudomonadota bacterium]MBU4472340.1 hydrogenase [Pseudomonadota bacterium]MCG2752036.1 hydrogenase [Desulfobacteraceae bacterium]